MTPTSPAPTPDDPRVGDVASAPRAAFLTDADIAQAVGWIERRVTRWGCLHHLRAADVDDARQEAELAMVRAARDFDPRRLQVPVEHAWRSFVGLVVMHTLSNFRRGQRRLANHYLTVTDMARLLEGLGPGSRVVRLLVSGEEDPALLAEWQEWQSRADAAVRNLSEEERRLYEMRDAEETLEEMARQLGVSVKVVRGKIKKLWAKLKAALGDL